MATPCREGIYSFAYDTNFHKKSRVLARLFCMLILAVDYAIPRTLRLAKAHCRRAPYTNVLAVADTKKGRAST